VKVAPETMSEVGLDADDLAIPLEYDRWVVGRDSDPQGGLTESGGTEVRAAGERPSYEEKRSGEP